MIRVHYLEYLIKKLFTESNYVFFCTEIAVLDINPYVEAWPPLLNLSWSSANFYSYMIHFKPWTTIVAILFYTPVWFNNFLVYIIKI